mmetsp:Transcript_842/g.1485  ORF Transcript_842/g.1485 Transcript_842/m.1485 type:complete len:589 (-) Transcript_842:419-2185(-)|eukprot:CAMPEP_0198231742 /NCGR_PEP_ID=MMETSP1445-20131203/115362_1 /TAXON_ID=36898 /ORGANISM="Pyramimonas sp., Strain CCMP2087" /LENGTH=588 /DNA_ID=CAMNT_0043912375 /DNA_START=91 /DNA_END=1857 /DNA_ORIENTATION=-
MEDAEKELSADAKDPVEDARVEPPKYTSALAQPAALPPSFARAAAKQTPPAGGQQEWLQVLASASKKGENFQGNSSEEPSKPADTSKPAEISAKSVKAAQNQEEEEAGGKPAAIPQGASGSGRHEGGADASKIAQEFAQKSAHINRAKAKKANISAPAVELAEAGGPVHASSQAEPTSTTSSFISQFFAASDSPSASPKASAGPKGQTVREFLKSNPPLPKVPTPKPAPKAPPADASQTKQESSKSNPRQEMVVHRPVQEPQAAPQQQAVAAAPQQQEVAMVPARVPGPGASTSSFTSSFKAHKQRVAARAQFGDDSSIIPRSLEDHPEIQRKLHQNSQKLQEGASPYDEDYKIVVDPVFEDLPVRPVFGATGAKPMNPCYDQMIPTSEPLYQQQQQQSHQLPYPQADPSYQPSEQPTYQQAPDYNFAPDKPKLVAGGIGGAFTNLLADSYGVSAVMDWKDRAVPPQGGTFSTAELDEIYRMGFEAGKGARELDRGRSSLLDGMQQRYPPGSFMGRAVGTMADWYAYMTSWRVTSAILATLVLMMLFTFEEELLLAYTAARETVGSKSVILKAFKGSASGASMQTTGS